MSLQTVLGDDLLPPPPKKNQGGGDDLLPPPPKKKESEALPSKSLDGRLPSVAQEIKPVDIADPIAASLQADELSKATKEISMGAGGVAMGTGYATVPDEEKVKQSKAITDQLKVQGIPDPSNLAAEHQGLTDNEYGKQGFDKQTLLQDRSQNNELYQRKIANLKWRKGVDETLANSLIDGQISKDEYDRLNHAIQSSLNNASVGNYDQQRDNINTVAKIIQNFGGVNKDELLKNYAVEVGKVYGNSYVNGFDNTAANQPESKYLNNNALLGYNYLHDIDPEKAAQYERAFVDPKTLKDMPDAKRGYDHLMQTLEETGIGLQQNAVNEELNNLINISQRNNGITIEQLKKANTLKAKKAELAKANDELDNKYPDRLVNKIDDATQEILGQNMNWFDYAMGKSGKAVMNTGQGLWEAVSNPFLSNEDTQMRELAILGEVNPYHLTDKNKALQTDKLVIHPELQAKVDAIKNDKALSDDEKRGAMYSLLAQNKDKFGRVPIQGGQMNVSPSSVLYAVTDIGATLLPFIGLDAVTGGGATAGVARKFMSTFTAAATTGFHDAYAEAVKSGKSQSDAYKEALGMTAINSAALAGAGTPDAIRAMLGTSNTAGKIVNGMTDGAINKVISNTPKGWGKLMDVLKNRAAATPKMLAEGLKGGAKLEVANTIGNEFKHQLYNTPIDREQNFKQSVLGVLNFGILGSGLGHIGYKSPTELQKSSFMEVGKKPDEYIAHAQQMVKDGNLSQSDFEQVKTNIENSATVYKNLPDVNSKGKPLSEKQKADILYNEAVKNEANKKALTITQKEKAEHISLVSDYKNDLIAEQPTDAQLTSRKNSLEKSLEPKKDAEGKDIGLDDKEKAKAKAQLEAVNSEIEDRSKKTKEQKESSITPPQQFPEPITIGNEEVTTPKEDVSIKSGDKIQWDVFGNEDSETWDVVNETTTRGGKRAVTLRKRYVEASSNGQTYSKEYADKNGIKYDNEHTIEHIVPIDELNTTEKQKTEDVSISGDKITTPEGFKNSIHKGGIILGTPKDGDHITEEGYTYRKTDQRELDAIQKAGGVFSREGKQKGGRANVKFWSEGDGKLFYRPDGGAVIRVKNENINTSEVVKASDVEVWDSKNNKFNPLSEKQAPKDVSIPVSENPIENETEATQNPIETSTESKTVEKEIKALQEERDAKIKEINKPEVKLEFVDEDKLPKVETDVTYKGEVIGKKMVVDPKLIERQKNIKDRFNKLKDFIDCLTK